MTILVQREFRVDPADRAELERQSREGLWPAFLRFGVFMVAYGTRAFEGEGDVVVTHTMYANFEHWSATRACGAFYRDPATAEEIVALRPIYAGHGRLIAGSRARVFDVADIGASPQPFMRAPGTAVPDPPPTFGNGPVVAEWTHAATQPDAGDEWAALMRAHVWPWLEGPGARLVMHGRSPLSPSGESVTLVAYRSLAEWHRLAQPAALDPPATVAAALDRCGELAPLRAGRVLTVGTDFGLDA